MSANTDRFLSAFNRIQKRMRDITLSDSAESFMSLLRRAAEKDAAFRRYLNDLREYEELRNALVHDYYGNFIAEPYDDTISHLERIASILTNPPSIEAVMMPNPFCLSANESLGEGVVKLFKNGYSQAPVHEGELWIGLLTTNTIGRWLGACAGDDLISLKESTIKDVLKYTEQDSQTYKFVPRTLSIFDALQEFEKTEKKGQRLEALLVTQNGKEKEKLLGIFTIWDLPKTYEAIRL
jgi:CBS domain-containing protein